MSNYLDQTAQLLTATQVVIAVCASILLVAVWAALHIVRRCRLVREHFGQAHDALGKVTTPQEFTTAFAGIDRAVSEEVLLGPDWARFSSGLLPPHASVSFFRSPVEPHAIFRFDSIVGRQMNLRLVQVIPSYLTGAGIFFTFTGLVAGIHVASQGLASPNLQDARAALNPLLRGAGLAFGTSMAGLFGSIAVSWLEKAQFNRIGNLLSAWNERLHRLVPVVSAERVASEQLLELEKQTVQLERFNTDLAVSIATALDSRIADRVVPVLDKIAALLNALNDKQSKIGQEVISQVGDTIADAVKGATGKESEAMRAALVEITGALQAASEAVRHQHQVGQTNLQSMLASIAGMLESVEAVVARLGELGSGLAVTLPEIAQANIALKETTEPLNGLATQMREVASQIGEQVASISGAAASIQEASRNLNEMQNSLKATWSDYENRFAGVDQALASTLDQITKGCDLYGEKIRELNQGLDKHFGKALSDLAGVINELHEAVDELQQAQSGRPSR